MRTTRASPASIGERAESWALMAEHTGKGPVRDSGGGESGLAAQVDAGSNSQ